MSRVPAACLRLEQRVAAAVQMHAVFQPAESVLLLLSGGADSMAMLAMLLRLHGRLGLRLRLAALHVDYAARGVDSDRDRDIVERACEAAGVPLHVVRLTQRLSGGDFQARARELRYRRARECVARDAHDVIATAHNRDDQTETILYRLAKYASPRGLAGMRPRGGDLARPLLGLGAAEIRAYCRACGIEYGDDATNVTTAYARNRLRLEVVPRLEELNPRLSETLYETALQAAAEADVLGLVVAEARARVTPAQGLGTGPRPPAPPAGGRSELPVVDVAALAAEPAAIQALVAHDLLRDAVGSEALVERRLVAALLALARRTQAGGRVSLGRGLEAVRERGFVRLIRVEPPHRCEPMSVEGAALVEAGGRGVAIDFCGCVYRVRLLPGAVLTREAALAGEAFVGLHATPQTVAVRHPRCGERFAPCGLGHETTAARYLAGARAPAPARRRAVVIDVDSAAAWIGHMDVDGTLVGRVAQDFRVAQSSTSTLHVFQEGL